MERKKIIWAALIVIAAACSAVPLTGRKQFTAIPSSQMNALSKDSYNEVIKESKLSTNQNYISTVNSVGQNISTAVVEFMRANKMSEVISGYSWEYRVLESDQINAWCMPGGKIAFYEGIMPICADDNGVAVVMSHEIAHAIAKHGNERLSQQLAIQLGGMALAEALSKEKETTQQLALLAFGVGSQLGVVLPYSRTHEKEADKLGLYFMAMAGYNPNEAVAFWKRMAEKSRGQEPPQFLSTHPNTEERIIALQKNMNNAMKYYNKDKAKSLKNNKLKQPLKDNSKPEKKGNTSKPVKKTTGETPKKPTTK